MTDTKKTETKGHEIGDQLNEKSTNFLYFSGLKFEVKYLTPADQAAAERFAKKPGSNPKRPKIDIEKKGEELVFMAIVGWTHEDGGKLLNGGKEIEVTRENVKKFIYSYPGLGVHILQHVLNADTMYRTISEEDAKN